MLIVFVVGAALNAPSAIENQVAPRATIVSELGTDSHSSDEQLFLDGLTPYLDILVGEGRALQTLGNARSRNIVELSLRMDRYRTAANDINQYVRDNSTPPRLTSFVSELQQRIDESLSAIDASIAAVRQFDWQALAASVSAFSDSVDRIARLAATPVAEQQ
jgi:hypothetical protein